MNDSNPLRDRMFSDFMQEVPPLARDLLSTLSLASKARGDYMMHLSGVLAGKLEKLAEALHKWPACDFGLASVPLGDGERRLLTHMLEGKLVWRELIADLLGKAQP